MRNKEKAENLVSSEVNTLCIKVYYQESEKTVHRIEKNISKSHI